MSVTAVVPKIAHTLNGKLATEWENADNCYDADMEGIFEFADDKATCENHGKGYYICEDCGEMVFVETFRGHSYDTSEITKPATCTEDGVREFTCSTCGGTYTEKIPAKGHDYVVVGFSDASHGQYERTGCNRVQQRGLRDNAYNHSSRTYRQLLQEAGDCGSRLQQRGTDTLYV